MADGYRYKAFISYSHRDQKWGRWLLRAIETYRIPKRFVGQKTSRGAVPRRLVPVFQDRHELPASEDLNSQVHKALNDSACLIVVCSPEAAASQWVNREIIEFKKLHGDRNVLALVVAGEPFASERGADDKECFPLALRRRIGPDGNLLDERAEPTAADLRKHADGRRLARLKLIAGITGLPLDDLAQRDFQRRLKTVTAVTLLALVAVLMMAAATFQAIEARHEADARRAEAEGLVEFMLTDLRKKLEPVGRLDVLDAVGERAIGYYATQRLEEMPDDAIGRRARSYHLLGEVDELKGDLDGAAEMFQLAWDDTALLLSRTPDDPRRIFDHAQSVYWLAYLDWRRGDYEATEAGFRQYKDFAERLIAIEPENPKYLQEVAYANTNLGVLRLQFNRPQEALSAFLSALETHTELVRIRPHDNDFLRSLANVHAWTADAIRVVGHLSEARQHRLEQLRIYDRLLEGDPKNFAVRDERLTAQLALARLELDMGQVREAEALLLAAARDAEDIAAHDPENALWIRNAEMVDINLAELYLETRDLDAAEAALIRAAALESDLRKRNALSRSWQVRLAYRRQLVEARLDLLRSDVGAAEEKVKHLLSDLKKEGEDGQVTPILFNLRLSTLMLLGEIKEGSGDIIGARETWSDLIKISESYTQTLGPSGRDKIARINQYLGNVKIARKIVKELRTQEYARPAFMAFCRRFLPETCAAAE